jgi:hypothetical protein
MCSTGYPNAIGSLKMKELYAKTPWRSQIKWLDTALRNGFSRNEALLFFKSNANHDFKLTRDDSQFRPILGRKMKSCQFDILVQRSASQFMMFINTNSRKGYAYEMKNKGGSEVLAALKRHIAKVGQIAELSSDQDKAYLSDMVQKFILENHIDHFSTEEKNHHKLGLINRFIGTLRNLNSKRNFTEARMNELVSEYNDSRHRAINKAPNQFTETDEIKYVADKLNEDDAKNILGLKPGDHVKVLNEHLFKKRRNYSDEVYRLNSKDGNQYIVEAEDKSVMTYPRHKLKLVALRHDQRSVSGGAIGKSLNDAKRG